MLPQLRTVLECPICYNTLSLPVSICQKNGHAICTNCRKSILSCPFCKSGWSRSRQILLENILQVMLPCCAFCKQSQYAPSMREHENRFCPKKIIRCFIFSRGRRCPYEFSREDLLVHLYDRHSSQKKILVARLGETVIVPVKNVFLTKNISLLFRVELKTKNSPLFFVLLTLYGDISAKVFHVSVNVVQNCAEDFGRYLFSFYTLRRETLLHSFTGPCTSISDMPKRPDRFPGGHRSRRITFPQNSKIFTDKAQHLYTMLLKIQLP